MKTPFHREKEEDFGIKSISVEVVISKDKYDKLSSIAKSNGWTMQGLLGPMLLGNANSILEEERKEE